MQDDSLDNNRCARAAMGERPGNWSDYLDDYCPTITPIEEDGRGGICITPRDPNEGPRRALENYLARQDD